MVPHSWIVNCLKMYKISDKVFKFIMEVRKNWKSGIDSKRKNFNRGENPERHLQGRCAFTIAICFNNDAIQLHA